ncbi:MAG TPA: hypothetical protein PKD98_32115 [Anaerolineae bacterium]|nr:hypothetical protein [Anaerolineae bacterium]
MAVVVTGRVVRLGETIQIVIGIDDGVGQGSRDSLWVGQALALSGAEAGGGEGVVGGEEQPVDPQAVFAQPQVEGIDAGGRNRQSLRTLF